MKLFKIVFFLFFTFFLSAKDFRTLHSKAWQQSNLNNSAIALYGSAKFSTIQKSDKIELIVPKITISDSSNIPVIIKSSLKAKSVALFQDKENKSLIVVFSVLKNGIVEYEFNIQKEIRGTLFAVVEIVEGKLYYTRVFVDVLCLACVRGEE